MEPFRTRSVKFTTEGMVATNTLERKNTVILDTENDSKVSSTDILSSIQSINSDLIETIMCLQNTAPNCFLLTFHEEDPMEFYLDNLMEIKVNDNIVRAKRCETQTRDHVVDQVPITVYNCPIQINDDVISSKLSQYCIVMRCHRPSFKVFPTVKSGVRIFYTKDIRAPVPSHIYIKGVRCAVRHEGQVRGKNCYNCKAEGHLGRECPNPDNRREARGHGLDTNYTEAVYRATFPELPQSTPTYNGIVEDQMENGNGNTKYGNEIFDKNQENKVIPREEIEQNENNDLELLKDDIAAGYNKSEITGNTEQPVMTDQLEGDDVSSKSPRVTLVGHSGSMSGASSIMESDHSSFFENVKQFIGRKDKRKNSSDTSSSLISDTVKLLRKPRIPEKPLNKKTKN
ncbi:hypothetical protein SNE40_022362 [Patella caerulea]|uniref:CCHC-type domain-containing protein n=1 Tax=Patella caerulea TaxID=87958 RepID=A0AAN8GFM9_PATCE